MCTLSFLLESGGYELFFSRDERRSRAAARPPRLERAAEARFLAPRDPEAGGTWLAANEHGVTLALLNRYGVTHPGSDFESRGRLVLELASARSLRAVEAQLRGRSLGRVRPFDLAVFEPDRPVACIGWDGRVLTLERAASAPLCSSAVADSEARAARRARFAEHCAASGAPTTHSLAAFHREHAPARGALSPCMHRADARTVSLSRVRVTRERVALSYAAGSPCRARFGRELELARA
ncbi:MAG: NRDE family protein [Myxococcota bacterium]